MIVMRVEITHSVPHDKDIDVLKVFTFPQKHFCVCFVYFQKKFVCFKTVSYMFTYFIYIN